MIWIRLQGLNIAIKLSPIILKRKIRPKKSKLFIKMIRKFRKQSSPVRLRYMIAFDDEGSRAGFGVDRMVHTNGNNEKFL